MFYVDFQRRENNRISKKINEASRPPNKKDEFLIEESEHQNPDMMKINSEIKTENKVIAIQYDSAGIIDLYLVSLPLKWQS